MTILPLVLRLLSALSWQEIAVPDYGTADVWVRNAAIAWYGQVGAHQPYTDLRLGYNDAELYAQFLVFDLVLADSDKVTLQVGDYRIDAALSGEHRLYRNGTLVPDSITADTVWRGNNWADAWGWWVELHIPWADLGDKPAPGTRWAMRATTTDHAGASASLSSVLVFGPRYDVRTEPYARPSVANPQTVTIRNGQGGQTVLDAVVGGGSLCGDPAMALAAQRGVSAFETWGDFNWASQYLDYPIDYLTVQNQQDVADWTCFSKVLGQFPLPLPSGKQVFSATLTLRNYGHSGYDWQEKLSVPAVVFEMDKPLDPLAVTWNNAPVPRKAIDFQWIPLIDNVTVFPHQAITWDVSAAVARAYAEGRPFRYLLYSADTPISSGAYLDSSRWTWQPEYLPALTITFGE